MLVLLLSLCSIIWSQYYNTSSIASFAQNYFGYLWSFEF
jgi:hypothetical protein